MGLLLYTESQCPKAYSFIKLQLSINLCMWVHNVHMDMHAPWMLSNVSHKHCTHIQLLQAPVPCLSYCSKCNIEHWIAFLMTLLLILCIVHFQISKGGTFSLSGPFSYTYARLFPSRVSGIRNSVVFAPMWNFNGIGI